MHTDWIFKGVFETALEGMIITNERGIVQAINPAAVKLFGYMPDEIVDANISMLIPKHHAKEHDSYIKRYQDTKEKHIIGAGRAVEAKRKDGTVFPIFLSVNEFNIDGDVFFAGILRDISSQINNEFFLNKQMDRLEELNKELESFSYSVSHDLTAPLRHIIGYIELVKQHIAVTSDKNLTKYVTVIQREAQRMEQLILSLLNLSRLGRSSLQKQVVSCHEIINQVIERLTSDLETTPIKWQIEPLPEIFCDKNMIVSVWENLLSNAIKFTKYTPKAMIKISSSALKGTYQFSIQDNGAGFDATQTDRLFNIFQRLHPPDKFPGTGIGLVNAKKIVEKHGGRIWIEGKKNKGTTVHFTIPIKS